jgi:hypothetical protein
VKKIQIRPDEKLMEVTSQNGKKSHFPLSMCFKAMGLEYGLKN